MRNLLRTIWLLLSMLFALSGCILIDAVVDGANSAPCNDLPGTARRDCQKRRGELEYPFASTHTAVR